MSETTDDKLHTSKQPTVKKRSLSSYLSNVSNRKEELEKIAHTTLETEQQSSNQDSIKQSMSSKQGTPTFNSAAGLDPKSRHSEELDDTLVKKPRESTLEPVGLNKSEQPSKGEDKSTKMEGNEKSELTKLSGDNPKTQGIESGNETPSDGIVKGSFSRDDLKDMLGQLDDNRRGQINKGPPSDNIDEEDSELSEVESDAPTEPASPPRPRRGKLIRGDHLRSSPSRRSPKIRSSDSELSDIEDMKNIPISSSILHGDSSPEKVHHTYLNSSPVNVFKKEQHSNTSVRKHIALPKGSRSRKSIHRDAGGRTKLQIACDKGKYESAKKLIEEGYDVNDQDNAGNSPLHEAALNGHLEIVKLLIENGVNVNIQSYDPVKDTPLIDASANGHLDVVKLLLEHFADPTIVNAKGLTAIESIDEEEDLDDSEMEIVKEMKDTLRAAMKYHRQPSDKSRVRSSSNNRHSDRERSSSNVRVEDEFYWTDTTSKVGKEKLLKASKEGRLAYVGAYLENGGRVDFKSFIEAVKFGHEDIASLFLAFGAQVNMVSREGQTPLMISVGRGHIGTAKLLLEAGADPTKRDKYGKSVLSYVKSSAMGFMDEQEIQLIKDALHASGANVDDEEETSMDKEFETPGVEHHNRSSKLESDHRSGETDKVSRKRKTISPTATSPSKRLLQSENQSKGKFQLGKSSSEPTIMTDAHSKSAVNDSHVSKKLKQESSPSPGAVIPQRSQTATPTTSVTPKPTETTEEKEQRLKAEEQYRMRRLLHKKKKEQELLHKLEMDEKKRLEDRKRQQEELKMKLELEKQKEEQKQEMLRNQAEIDRRHLIRSLYPLGLKIVDFEDKSDYHRYLPVYYVMIDGVKRVLDLQICILLKDWHIITKFEDMIEIPQMHKEQLWNIYQFIFLRGGSGPGTKYIVTFDDLTLDSRVQIEKKELAKFLSLPVHWVPWDSIDFSNKELKDEIQKNMVELDLLDTSRMPALKHSNSSSSVAKPAFSNQSLNEALPVQLLNRPAITQFLKNSSLQW